MELKAEWSILGVLALSGKFEKVNSNILHKMEGKIGRELRRICFKFVVYE